MKKLICFTMCLIMIFSIFTFVNVSAAPQLEAESICHNVYKTFEFKQSNFNKEYSSENVEVQFNADNSITIKIKENIQECKLYFNLENADEIGKILNHDKYGC